VPVRGSKRDISRFLRKHRALRRHSSEEAQL
jgi:hypothetical protein